MKKNKGFTLVEIMIVVVIIGLLAAMAVPAFQQVRKSSTEKATLNDLRQVAAAADQYFLEENVATVDIDSLIPTYIKTLSITVADITPDPVLSSTTQLSYTTAFGDTVTYDMGPTN